ncbi:uncharacterized protein LOC141660318 [Apium graveolens]|uniref:uncharacterized protein LOC141660318 n=1 Tax=Apium graveolens TaxID=4045 RepID=UPI003D7A1BD1
MRGASDNVDPDIVEELLSMLDKNNELVKAFRMARNRFENEDLDEFKLVLISSQSSSGRPNHITPSNEVAVFIVSDDTDTGGFRDTVVNSKQEGLKRIYKIYPHFMQLQYPLLFPWGTEGYQKRIPLISNKYSKIENLDGEDLDPDSTQRRHISLREYYYYKIMIRTSEGLTPHLTGRLWQKYVMDHKGDHDPMHVGKAVKLLASFTGSQRYMSQYFKDSFAICRVIGHPSLFLTMSCNSKWPEIQEMLKLLPNVYPVDAPNIVSHKHGLPHVHMLIWPSPESIPNSIEKVDQLVSAEIPNKNSDPIAYEAVKNYMMHVPCDKDLYTSPCMVKGKFMRQFPKRFNGNTYFDDYGFSVYRRRDTGVVINKKGINLDNQYMLEHLPLFFGAEIEKLLNDVGKSLRDFHMMPFPDERFFHTFVNRLIIEETTYNKEELRLNHKKAHKNLNSRQVDVYNAVVDNVNKNKGGMFFVYGSGGCGKAFLWQTLCSRFRSEGKIVLPVAGSEIAATLLPGGRTTHSRFKIPHKLDQSSIAGIKYGTNIAELMQHTSLIIWDEAPMQHRYVFEAVDRSLRDILATVDVERGKRAFGGITVVFGSDF